MLHLSFFQEVFTLTLSVMWAQAAKNVQLVLLFRLIKHQENYLKIASRVLRVSSEEIVLWLLLLGL